MNERVSPARRFPAYVLAGGKSSRFGSDKALVSIEGKPQAQQLYEQLELSGHQTSFVCDSRNRLSAIGIDAIVDTVPDAGPMSGLTAALEHHCEGSGSGWILLVACDQLRWHRGWTESLVAATKQGDVAVTYSLESTAEKIAFRQPIPGLYHTDLVPVLQKSLQLGRYSLRRLLDELCCPAVTTGENPRDWMFNSPDELRELLNRH